MTFNVNTTASKQHHSNVGSFKSVAEFFAKIREGAGVFFKALQDARMVSTLTQMSDNQLKQIGLTRSDIPDYAKKLMANEDTETK